MPPAIMTHAHNAAQQQRVQGHNGYLLSTATPYHTTQVMGPVRCLALYWRLAQPAQHLEEAMMTCWSSAHLLPSLNPGGWHDQRREMLCQV
jgi:hypothetical protein